MSENNKQHKQSSRLERFLFYAKFVVLIIVAVLFIIAYSFSYRDFPVSNAQYQITDRYSSLSETKTLIVMNTRTAFEHDTYIQFYHINDLIDKMNDFDYDLVLVQNAGDNLSILNNPNDGLLLRVYNDEDYKYIISIGDNAIQPSEEIRELFFPKTQILIYDASSSAINDIITAEVSADDSVLQSVLVSQQLNSDTKELIFLCDNDDYCDAVMNVVKNQQDEFGNIPYTVLYSDEYTLDAAIKQINLNTNNPSIFYVSFTQNTETSEIHGDIINQIQSLISTPVYDLSPITESKDIRSSIRYYPQETLNEPLAYLGLSLDASSIFGCELVEFAAANITPDNENKEVMLQYADNSAFIDWCMENIGFAEFPENISDQFNFCYDNSLLISRNNLNPGDLIFTSTKKDGTVEDIDDISIYVNEEIIISVNHQGILCFTRPINAHTPIAYAHPYSYLLSDEENP